MRPGFTSALLAATALLAAAAPPPVGRPSVQPISATVPNRAASGNAATAPMESIVAVVNGDVISQGDVQARARLFALSTGLPMSPDVLNRLEPQIKRQLVDERLRLQEAQRRKIVVTDKEIADAIGSIEQRNNMPSGALRQKLGAQGVALRTLVDQTRVQIGWTRVLREELGPRAEITDADIAAQQAVIKAETGQPEYRVAEIFLPIEDPAKTADTQRFADTVIGQLRTGAPFPVVAAQFSQSQTALQGGDLGWVRASTLDPQVVHVLSDMPVGAVSNPIVVPGGIIIITLHDKREVGRDIATVVSLRQVFLPFATALNPQEPTEQQKKQLAAAETIAKTVHSCDAMEAAAKALNSPRPPDPGEVRLEGLAGPMRALLTPMQPGQASRPLISTDGIGVVIVCSREQKNIADASKEEISNQLLNQRVELVSRQVVRDLRRQAYIDQRS